MVRGLIVFLMICGLMIGSSLAYLRFFHPLNIEGDTWSGLKSFLFKLNEVEVIFESGVNKENVKVYFSDSGEKTRLQEGENFGIVPSGYGRDNFSVEFPAGKIVELSHFNENSWFVNRYKITIHSDNKASLDVSLVE